MFLKELFLLLSDFAYTITLRVRQGRKTIIILDVDGGREAQSPHLAKNKQLWLKIQVSVSNRTGWITKSVS